MKQHHIYHFHKHECLSVNSCISVHPTFVLSYDSMLRFREDDDHNMDYGSLHLLAPAHISCHCTATEQTQYIQYDICSISSNPVTQLFKTRC